jgi:hypothetical protein
MSDRTINKIFTTTIAAMVIFMAYVVYTEGMWGKLGASFSMSSGESLLASGALVCCATYILYLGWKPKCT